MTSVKSPWFGLITRYILSLSAIGLLTACGKDTPSSAPVGSTPEVAQAKSSKQCFLPVGHLSDNDAELFAASGAGDVRRVEQSIDAGGNVNATDSLKRTPLFATAFCNKSQITSLLIDRGSSTEVKDFNGMAPVHAAVIAGADEVVKVLMSKGVNINIQTSANNTPLHLAAATGQLGMVKLLLELGADTRVRSKNGLTAAALASENSHAKVATTIKKWLEKRNAIQK